MTQRGSAFLRERLGVALSIVQAPMANSQGSALAIAVANAGGLGSLPCATLTASTMRDELATIAHATSAPINVNFFCHTPPTPDDEREGAWRHALAPYFAEYGLDAATIAPAPSRAPFSHDAADVLEAFRPAVVSFHFGLPSPDLIARVRAWGALVLSSATTVDEARWLEANSADVIIAQGVEAGGHRGMFLSTDISTQVGTFALLPQIVHAVNVPVIAAGGIADATGVQAAITLGAAAVQVGTAYLRCPEATTSAVHRDALSGDHAHLTALTNLFTGRPARSIVNRIMREIGPMNDVAPAFPLASGALAPLRTHAERMGSGDFSPLWAGQNTSGCRDVPASEITRNLASSLAV